MSSPYRNSDSKTSRHMHRIDELMSSHRKKSTASPIKSKSPTQTANFDSHLSYKCSLKIIQRVITYNQKIILMHFFSRIRSIQPTKHERIYRYVTIERQEPTLMIIDSNIKGKILSSVLKNYLKKVKRQGFDQIKQLKRENIKENTDRKRNSGSVLDEREANIQQIKRSRAVSQQLKSLKSFCGKQICMTWVSMHKNILKEVYSLIRITGYKRHFRAVAKEDSKKEVTVKFVKQSSESTFPSESAKACLIARYIFTRFFDKTKMALMLSCCMVAKKSSKVKKEGRCFSGVCQINRILSIQIRNKQQNGMKAIYSFCSFQRAIPKRYALLACSCRLACKRVMLNLQREAFFFLPKGLNTQSKILIKHQKAESPFGEKNSQLLQKMEPQETKHKFASQLISSLGKSPSSTNIDFNLFLKNLGKVVLMVNRMIIPMRVAFDAIDSYASFSYQVDESFQKTIRNRLSFGFKAILAVSGKSKITNQNLMLLEGILRRKVLAVQIDIFSRLVVIAKINPKKHRQLLEGIQSRKIQLSSFLFDRDQQQAALHRNWTEIQGKIYEQD